MPQKGSTPWSTRTVAEGGTDSPVGDLVPVPDSVQPIINAGFIDESGKWRISAAADDKAFTFQDPSQAIGPGADVEFPINMLNHDIIILALLDASGNDINVDIIAQNPTTLEGPYNVPQFIDTAVNGDAVWEDNLHNGGQFQYMMRDTDQVLDAAWQFYKITSMRGTQIRMLIHNNHGSNAGTLSTAYLRLV